MAKKSIDEDGLIEEFDDEGGLEFDQGDELDFAGEDDLLTEDMEEEEDLAPSVLYKGISRPKTDEDWRQLLMEASQDGVPAYQISEGYREGDLIVHPEFALGVVSKVISPKKMEVIFERSKKLMAQNVIPPK